MRSKRRRERYYLQKTNSFSLPRSWRFVCGLHKIGFGLILQDGERHRPLQVFIKFYGIAGRGGAYAPARENISYRWRFCRVRRPRRTVIYHKLIAAGCLFTAGASPRPTFKNRQGTVHCLLYFQSPKCVCSEE